MANLLSGLDKFGLGNLDEAKIFGDPAKKEEEKKASTAAAAQKPVAEEEFLLKKSFVCPLCDTEFKDLTMRTGKARSAGQDVDTRQRYEHFDAEKYGVISCPNCGYTTLGAPRDLPTAVKALIKTNISDSFIKRPLEPPATYTYEEAFERYQLCLANAIVKMAKDSEKAVICLKTAWLLRSMAEHLPKDTPDYDQEIAEIKQKERDYLEHAHDGLLQASAHEPFPLAGMDENRIDYMLAALAVELKRYDEAGRMIGRVLQSKDSPYKEKARSLKDLMPKTK
jgi:uncharacterized protein (DUF2225 family)